MRSWQRGWAGYFSGEALDPPEWGITPDAAPKPGARIRLTCTETTLSGTTINEGELAVVTELYFLPLGIVRMTVRTLDGRTRGITQKDEYVRAT
jgi:hypothetical protein